MKTCKRREFKREGKFWVYIVECADKTYYTGYTRDLEKRFKLHNSGNGARYLRGKNPVRLVYAKEYKYYKNAVRAEIDIKKRNRREKETMIKAGGKNIDDTHGQVCKKTGGSLC